MNNFFIFLGISPKYRILVRKTLEISLFNDVFHVGPEWFHSVLKATQENNDSLTIRSQITNIFSLKPSPQFGMQASYRLNCGPPKFIYRSPNP